MVDSRLIKYGVNAKKGTILMIENRALFIDFYWSVDAVSAAKLAADFRD